MPTTSNIDISDQRSGDEGGRAAGPADRRAAFKGKCKAGGNAPPALPARQGGGGQDRQ